MEQLKAFLLAVITLLLVWFSLELDLFSAGAQRRWVVWLMLAVLFQLPVALAFWVRRSWSRPFVAVMVAIVCVAFLTPWHVHKQLVADLYSLQPGDTLARVNTVMARYTGVSVGPPEGLMFRHGDESYDADAALVYLVDGRVSRVEFQPD